MARKKGIAFWIDDDWRIAVRSRMDLLKWDALRLGKESKVGASTISELLSGVRSTCVKLPALHAALGFPPPCPPLLPDRLRRFLAAFESLGNEDVERGMLIALEASAKKRK